MSDNESIVPAEELLSWLVSRIAYYLEVAPEEIDAGAPFRSYGLNSVYAFSVCDDIEETFRITIDPALIWDFDTVAALAGQLASMVSANAE